MISGAGSLQRRATLDVAQQHRLLFEQHPSPMWLFDNESLAFLSANDAAVRTYGYSREEFAHFTLKDLSAPADLASLETRPWVGRREWSNTERHRRRDGGIIDVRVHYRAAHIDGRSAWLAVVEDITERRSLEAQLRQAQKIDVIGQLAGGIAHDFNNLLTAIQGYAELLSDRLPAYDPHRDDVQEISRAAERAAALTRRLLAFSRKQTSEPCVLSPSAAVQEVAPMLRRLVDATIEVTTVVNAKGRVKADAVELHQVLMNLVLNGRDAIDAGGGQIIVETADVVLDGTCGEGHLMPRPGPYVMLSVSDTGHGMSPETEARIFEPFFTTKPQGRGTGLGLSMVLGIVEQSGGHVCVQSQVDHGTTFKVYLPAVDELLVSPTLEDVPEVTRNTASVLLLEDEDAVRRLVTKVLESRGYLVHATAHPLDALAIARRTDVHIDLLLTDVVLPEMSGRAVAEAVRALHPDCRVLFMSGYTDDAVLRHGVLTVKALFLQKPFRANALAQKVAEALAS